MSALTRILAILTVALLILSTEAGGGSIELHKRSISGCTAYVITVDLNDPRIGLCIALPDDGIGRSQSFGSMVRRDKPVAAVTGTYFDTRSLLPVGTLIVEGKPAHVSCIGTAVAFTRNTGSGVAVRIIRCEPGKRTDWTGADSGLRCGPNLTDPGFRDLSVRSEGFRDPGLFGRRVRMALGLTKHNKLLLVHLRTPVTFGRLSAVMRQLGSVEAVALDGGGSSAMYFRGRIVCAPARRLTNIIEVFRAETAPVPPEVFAYEPTPSAPGEVQRCHCDGIGVAARSEFELVPRPETSFQLFTPYIAPHIVRTLPELTKLRGSKRFVAGVPVNGTQLAGLQRLKHTQHLINVAPNAHIMHHLVA